MTRGEAIDWFEEARSVRGAEMFEWISREIHQVMAGVHARAGSKVASKMLTSSGLDSRHCVLVQRAPIARKDEAAPDGQPLLDPWKTSTGISHPANGETFSPAVKISVEVLDARRIMRQQTAARLSLVSETRIDPRGAATYVRAIYFERAGLAVACVAPNRTLLFDTNPCDTAADWPRGLGLLHDNALASRVFHDTSLGRGRTVSYIVSGITNGNHLLHSDLVAVALREGPKLSAFVIPAGYDAQPPAAGPSPPPGSAPFFIETLKQFYTARAEVLDSVAVNVAGTFNFSTNGEFPLRFTSTSTIESALRITADFPEEREAAGGTDTLNSVLLIFRDAEARLARAQRAMKKYLEKQKGALEQAWAPGGWRYLEHCNACEAARVMRGKRARG
jgi:hypothetical protein